MYSDFNVDMYTSFDQQTTKISAYYWEFFCACLHAVCHSDCLLHSAEGVWEWAGSCWCCSPAWAVAKRHILAGLGPSQPSHFQPEALGMQLCLLSSPGAAVRHTHTEKDCHEICFFFFFLRILMRISDSYMCQHTDLFSQDAAWSSVQGSWTGVEKVVEPVQSLCKGGNMDVTGDRSHTNVDYSETDWRETSANNRQTGGLKTAGERERHFG